MIFLKVKAGDRVQIANIKSKEFKVRSYTFWRNHAYNYTYQDLDVDGFGVILCKYVTEIV